jgi:hypothetical protein
MYFPDTDVLQEKNEFNWFIPYQMNAPRTWTVFAETEALARQKVEAAKEQGEFNGNAVAQQRQG